MDKPGKTITIKINGKERSAIETVQERREDSNLSSSDPNDFSIETETAAARETTEESFDWILPELTKNQEKQTYPFEASTIYKKKKRLLSLNGRKRNNPKNIFTAILTVVFFAILLGTAFGFIILKLVLTDQQTQSALPEKGTPGTEHKNTQTVAAYQLEPISTFVVQEGVYTSEETAKKAQAAIGELGLPSQLLFMDGKYFLFLAASENLDHAKEIGNKLRERGLKPYEKPLELNGKNIDRLTEAEISLLKMAPALYGLLTMAEGEAWAGVITPELKTKIGDSADQLAAIADKNLSNTTLLKMKDDLTKAVEKVNALKQTNNSDVLFSLQKDLLSFLSAYSSLD